jgi:hypothetical protein
MKKRLIQLVVTLVLVMTASITANGAGKKNKELVIPDLAVELGAPFRDGAILQREMKVPVWGWSKPGTKVTVSFAGQTKEADCRKRWKMDVGT